VLPRPVVGFRGGSVFGLGHGGIEARFPAGVKPLAGCCRRICKRSLVSISTMRPRPAKALAKLGILAHQQASAISLGSRTRL
jgi:hypothetical protein